MNVCPEPSEWHRVHQELLAEAGDLNTADAPPIPLILGGWAFSTGHQKIERWRQTIDWAERYGLGHITGSVSAECFVHLDPDEPAWEPELDVDE